MGALWSRLKRLVLVVVLLLSVFSLVMMQKRMPKMWPALTSGFVDFSSFFQEGLVDFSGIVSDFFYRHFSDAASYEEVLRLQAELAKLHTTALILKEVEQENAQLKALFNTSEYIEGVKPILAKIIGRNGAPLTRSLRINVGKKEGIQRGDAVISVNGVVGQIVVVGQYASEVLLATDSSSAVDVVVQRSRARGIVKGKSNAGQYRLIVEDFDRLQDVQKGDILLSSGIGAQFPEGVPVGRILDVHLNHEGVSSIADIVPFTDFSHLEHVMVLPAAGKEKPWRMRDILAAEIESQTP